MRRAGFQRPGSSGISGWRSIVASAVCTLIQAPHVTFAPTLWNAHTGPHHTPERISRPPTELIAPGNYARNIRVDKRNPGERYCSISTPDFPPEGN
ncbi:hypothetical protein Ntsu_24280 [Nocardia sp. IFM 10818]